MPNICKACGSVLHDSTDNYPPIDRVVEVLYVGEWRKAYLTNNRRWQLVDIDEFTKGLLLLQEVTEWRNIDSFV